MNSAVSLWRLSTGGHQVFHPTYYNPYFLRHVGRTPFVVTVFNMIHELMPEALPPTEAGIVRRKRLLVGAASHVIAISHTTKRDLIRLHGIDDKRISVIHLAHSLDPRTHAGSGLSLPAEYLLFAGKREGYKNFATFLAAVDRSRGSRTR
jgi:glycosyltransferase involved in cell wall biosynthesis